MVELDVPKCNFSRERKKNTGTPLTLSWCGQNENYDKRARIVGSHNGKNLKQRDWDTCTSITVIVIKAWPLCHWSNPAVTVCTLQHILGTFSVRGLGRPPPSPPSGPALSRKQRFLNGWVSATTRDWFVEAGQRIATSTNCIQKFTNWV